MSAPIEVGGHLRIRPFNTAETYPEQRLSNDLSQAVVAGDTIYLRGQVAQDLETRESVAIGDPAGQTQRGDGQHRAAARPKPASGKEHIVTCTIYLTDIRHREAVYGVLGERLAGVFPCFTGVVVSALARPEWLVEVTATAVRS